MLCEKSQLPKSARLHSVWPLTLLPRKRVHSLSVELLNAFVCICPGSRDLGENRITLKRIPAHGLTLWQQPKKASVGRWSRATSEFPHRIAVRRRDLSNSLKAELLGYFALCGAQWTGYFYPRWRRANSLIEKGWLGWWLVKAVCSVNSTALWDTESTRAWLPLTQWSPVQQQIQLCTALPPGVALCYVPWLALMRGDPCSPQHNSYQLAVLDFTSHRLVTSRMDV